MSKIPIHKTIKQNIILGTFYGHMIYMSVPKEKKLPEYFFQKLFNDWIQAERDTAIEAYKTQLMESETIIGITKGVISRIKSYFPQHYKR